MAREIDRQHGAIVMGEEASLEAPGRAIKPGAMQEHHRGLGRIERRAARRRKDGMAVDVEPHGSGLLRGAQRLPEIVKNILGIFQADREPDHALADPGRGEAGGIELGMCRRGWMDH